MLANNEHFLKNEFPVLLHRLNADQKAVWGKMDLQQMVEHLRDVCKVANGKIILPLYNADPENLAAARGFLFSDALFQENFKLPAVPSEPRPHKFPDLETAIAKTMDELQDVFTYYHTNSTSTLMHPIFGPLNYAEQLHYLVKHLKHHLRQFGVDE